MNGRSLRCPAIQQQFCVMKFRVARHTSDLKMITAFYQEILRLEVLAQFSAHDGYDGIFLGIKGENWHLEFTVSADLPHHTTDEDDLLVFYVANKKEQDSVADRCRQAGIPLLVSKNPYWRINGISFADPDGFRIIVAIA